MPLENENTKHFVVIPAKDRKQDSVNICPKKGVEVEQ